MNSTNKIIDLDIEDLIPYSKADYIIESANGSTLEDEDIFPLGRGKIAKYKEREKAFLVLQRGEYLGKVKLKQILKRV